MRRHHRDRAFDVVLALTLTALASRWRRPLAILLAALVTSEVLLTALQAIAFNAPRARGPIDWLVIVVSLAGPIVEDPSGSSVGIMSAIDDSRRGPSPPPPRT